MATEMPRQGVPVSLSDLRSREWMQLTIGFFWRGIVWSLVSGMIGTLVSYAVAFGVWATLSGTPSPQTYNRIALPLTLLLGLLVSLATLRWFVRLILTGRYGALPLTVIREDGHSDCSSRTV